MAMSTSDLLPALSALPEHAEAAGPSDLLAARLPDVDADSFALEVSLDVEASLLTEGRSTPERRATLLAERLRVGLAERFSELDVGLAATSDGDWLVHVEKPGRGEVIGFRVSGDADGSAFATARAVFAALSAVPGVAAPPLPAAPAPLAYAEADDVALELIADAMGLKIPKTVGALVPYLGDIVTGLRLIRDATETRLDYLTLDWSERQRINAVKTLVVLQRFGVGTVMTLAGGALGASVVPVVGALIGAGGGSLAGGYLNTRLQPGMINLALALARLDREALFYLRNKPALDRLGASLRETAGGNKAVGRSRGRLGA